MSNLTYDDSTHTYARDGQPLVSVTTILGAVLPRKDGAPEIAIERARLRGTAVDLAFSSWIDTGKAVIPAGTELYDDQIDEVKHCVQLAIDWWRENRAGVQARAQVRLFGEREAGTADIVTDTETVEIIDLKGTYEISPTHHIQVGAYVDLFDSPSFAKGGILHVNKRFKKAVYTPVDVGRAIYDWDTCRRFYWLLQK